MKFVNLIKVFFKVVTGRASITPTKRRRPCLYAKRKMIWKTGRMFKVVGKLILIINVHIWKLTRTRKRVHWTCWRTIRYYVALCSEVFSRWQTVSTRLTELRNTYAGSSFVRSASGRENPKPRQSESVRNLRTRCYCSKIDIRLNTHALCPVISVIRVEINSITQRLQCGPCLVFSGVVNVCATQIITDFVTIRVNEKHAPVK